MTIRHKNSGRKLLLNTEISYVVVKILRDQSEMSKTGKSEVANMQLSLLLA